MPRAHTPAGRGRPSSRGARIGDEQARRRMAGSREAQAARGRQRHLGQDADDERQARRFQTFLHGPKRVCRARRLDEEAGGGRKTQKGKAVAVGGAELAGEHGGPAPEDAWRGARGRRCQRTQTPHGEPHRETESRRPSASSSTVAFRLHLVQGASIETAGEAVIDFGRAERPRARRRPGDGTLCGERGETLFEGGAWGSARAALERGNARAQTSEEGSLALRRGPLRNGEEGLAVPVRARRPKPYATKTRTWARLWPRDPLETGGRWDGGWGRLVHGDALATSLRDGAWRPSRSFFVLESFAAPVKPKRETKRDHMFHGAPRPRPRPQP